MDFFGVVFLLLFIFSVLCFVCICRSDADLSLSFCEKLRSGKLRKLQRRHFTCSAPIPTLYSSIKITGELKGKVVWITGASSGIGAALAVEAASRGARLVISARSIGKLEAVRRRCLEVGKFHGLDELDVFVLPMDVVDLDNHEDRVVKVLQHFGKISVLFLNAGRSQRAAWERVDPEVDRELLETNAVASAHLARKVLPYFLAQGGGAFAVVSGVAGKTGVPFMGSCCASKFALHGYFESLRMESVGSGLAITMICPGPTFSNILGNAATDKSGEVYGGTMSDVENRLSPERVAHLAALAVAHRMEEVWIAPFPFLPLLYFNQYMPTITKRLANYIGPKIMDKLKEQET